MLMWVMAAQHFLQIHGAIIHSLSCTTTLQLCSHSTTVWMRMSGCVCVCVCVCVCAARYEEYSIVMGQEEGEWQ